MDSIIKCRKCRNILVKVPVDSILDAHNLPLNEAQNAGDCEFLKDNTELFLHEDSLPDWIKEEIETSQWTKGKLKCFKCQARVGAFDYVSGNQCTCLEHILPSVHIVKSKVDFKAGL